MKKKYKKSPLDYEKNAILALTSIYGIDLLKDNIHECRDRLFKIWDKEYTSTCKNEACDECRDIAKYILEKNILCGNALTLLKDDGTPIIFAEWSLVTGCMIKRRDFALCEMLEGHEEQMSLFMEDWEYDDEIKAYIPKPVREYEMIHYRRLNEYG